MFGKLLLSLALAIGPIAPLACAGPKAEKECPHALGDFDKITHDLDKAPTCSASLALFGACAVGASSDVRLGGVVLERCERGFLARLNAAQKRAYGAEQKRCARKYSGQDGTMYRSAEAFCRAQTAEKYAKRFANAARRARR